MAEETKNQPQKDAPVIEAGDRERATQEVLQIISQSRDDVQPVFTAILQRACLLCEAPSGGLLLGGPNDETMTFEASLGENARFDDALKSAVIPMDKDVSYASRAVLESKIYHLEDMGQSELYKQGSSFVRKNVDELGIRSVIFVPLIGPDGPLGAMALFRKEVKPFDANQVKLIESFAAQAAIAIENVRQFSELQKRTSEIAESLEQQTATADLLKVISKSVFDLPTVLQEVIEAAARLCGASICILFERQGDGMHLGANFGCSSEMVEFHRNNPNPIDRSNVAGRATLEKQTVHVPDVTQNPGYKLTGSFELGGWRSIIAVPLIRDGEVIAVLALSRPEVGTFSARQIELVETFADQAAIAINNANLFNEVQSRLAREEATGEILRVISSSRDDDRPVFHAVLENASRLCGAPAAVLELIDETGENLIVAASWGEELRSLKVGDTYPVRDGFVATKSLNEKCVVQIEDVSKSDLYKEGSAVRTQMVEEENLRTLAVVPLVRGDTAIGCISLCRREVERFSEDEIALVETFASQAVIAIENVQQFKELQTRLEREAATRNVLQVISQSRDDENPVFNVILQNAARLCKSPSADLHLTSDSGVSFTLTAHWGDPYQQDGNEGFKFHVVGTEFEPSEDLALPRSVKEKKVIQIEDVKDDEIYRRGDPLRVELVDKEKIRTFMAVPLIQQDEAIGSITMYRREVNPFSPDEIALVQTFAAQAVIAIENVRQFRALETLNAELGDRVEEQVGEIERMGKLKRFLPAAVADTVVSQGAEKILSSHRALLGVLFCDIRGFTAFCETAEPEETIEVLQTYH
ncbi:MAG: GAF domain-containing protein [Pseudomonadota bacterium]